MAAAGDGEARKDCRAPPWHAGTSGTSACTRRRRSAGPPRRQGVAPVTPSWRAQNAPRAGRHRSRGASVLAARRRRHAEAARALFAAVGEATTHQKLERPALRCVCGVGDGGGGPGRRADRACPARPPNSEGFRSVEGQPRRQGLYERRREELFDRNGGGGACVVPALTGSSGPARAMNILVHRGLIPPPPPERCGVVCVPLLEPGRGRRQPLRRVERAPTQRGWLRATPARVRRDRGERRAPAESETLWVGGARGRRGAVAARKSASRQRVRRVACAGQVRHVEAEVLDLAESADAHLVQMPVRLEPRDRLVVCPAPRRTGCSAAE